MITIADALKDPKLLGAALGEPQTWATWMTVLKSAFGITLSEAERNAFGTVAGDRAPPAKRLNELWAIVGRGGGKSRISAAIAVYLACFQDHAKILDPGETGYVLVLAGSRDQARAVFNYAVAFVRRSLILRKMIANITAHEIRLNNGAAIAVHSNSFRLIRGRTLRACIFDEVAFWRDELSAAPDLEVYRAVRPSLARTGGMLVGISSPYRRAGLLHQRYKDFYDVDSEDVLVVKGGTAQFDPTIGADTIAKEMAADPESARSEWDAEFRSDVSSLFDDAVIDDAVDHARPLELPPRGKYKYFAFADASAGRHDSFTLAIGHIEGGKPPDDTSWVCDVIRGRAAPFDPRSTAEEYSKLARQYGCTKVTGDAYAGEWVALAFADAGIKYETSPLNKSQLYLESLPSFNRGAVRIPDFPILLRELRSLERRTHRSGKDSVDHPARGSDDHANAVCGALNIANREIRRSTIRVGFGGMFGVPLTWRDAKPEPTRVRFTRVDENGRALAPAQHLTLER